MTNGSRTHITQDTFTLQSNATSPAKPTQPGSQHAKIAATIFLSLSLSLSISPPDLLDTRIPQGLLEALASLDESAKEVARILVESFGRLIVPCPAPLVTRRHRSGILVRGTLLGLAHGRNLGVSGFFAAQTKPSVATDCLHTRERPVGDLVGEVYTKRTPALLVLDPDPLM